MRKIIAGSILALALGTVPAVSGGSVFASQGGNSAAAHACQQSGYQTLVGLTSSDQAVPFSNTGACVSYAARGGTLYTPASTPTIISAYYDEGVPVHTGVSIPAGGVAVTTATGTAWFNTCSNNDTNTCNPTSAVGPDGRADPGNSFLFAYPYVTNNGALIGQVGTGHPFLVGAGPTVVTQQGEYSLGINTDYNFADNAGSFTATTTLYVPVA